MPLLSLLFSSLLGGLASFLGQFLTRKVAVVAAAGVVLGTITTALLVSFNTLVSPLVAVAFTTPYGQALGLAFPPIAGTCLASLATAWAACALYGWQLKALSIAVQA